MIYPLNSSQLHKKLELSRNKEAGGEGGDAEVVGNVSNAIGGDGGEAVLSSGGKGGKAQVLGNNSTAIGGKGGRGGVSQGMPGQDAIVDKDNSTCYGGQGGEASQLDGRGGRGGRPGLLLEIDDVVREKMGLGLQVQKHLKAPYWDNSNKEPGSGGDSADTPQYLARRLIIESLKTSYFLSKSIGFKDNEIWYDRDVVDLDWINEKLKSKDYRWMVSIVDDEYEFQDLV